MRILPIALLLAGCAVPAPAPVAPAEVSGSVPTPTGVLPSPSTPPPPVPPSPPNATAFLTGPDPALSSTGDPRVDAFRARILEEAGLGWRPYLLRLFAGVRANPDIVAAHRSMQLPQTPADWVRTYVTPQRIATGRQLYVQLRRDPPPSPAGTPLEVQLAMWGMLANYGSYRPPYDAIQTYLMLGAYGLGPGWTYFDFYKVAELIVTGQIPQALAKTHEDGRLGQVQLLPDEWRFARDGNGDGRIDIWTNRADIFASLGPVEWEAGVPMIVEVGRRHFDPNDVNHGRMLNAIRSGSVGIAMFPPPRGGGWPPELRHLSGVYVEPFGPNGPAYLLTRNFTPVNYRNPTKPRYWAESEDPGFGIAVALLADAIAGRPGPSIPIR